MPSQDIPCCAGIQLKLEKTKTRVLTYAETTPSLKIQGTITLLVESENKANPIKFYVIDSKPQ